MKSQVGASTMVISRERGSGTGSAAGAAEMVVKARPARKRSGVVKCIMAKF